MSVKIEVLPLETYRRFLAEADIMPATLYHNPLWLEAVQEGLGMEVVLLGAYDGPELIGVLPGFVARKYGVRLFGAPLRGSMTPYLGWLFKRGATPRVQVLWDRMQDVCNRVLRCRYAEVGFADPPAGLGSGSEPNGWHAASRQTYMLDLRAGEAGLWKNLQHVARTNIQKATKSGVVIESVTDRGILDEFYPMLQASYGRHRAVPPHPKKFFLALHDRLVPNGMMQVLAARHQGRTIAMSIFLHDERDIRHMSNASLRKYHPLRPNNLLQWHIIKWAAEQGLSRYDLGGKGQPSIDRFKETFGPTVHAYAFYWRASPTVAFARNLVVRGWPRVQWWGNRVRQTFAGAAAGGVGDRELHARRQEG